MTDSPHIFLSQIHAADNRHCPINQHDFAMVAEIGPTSKGEMDHRHKKRIFAPGSFKRREKTP